MKWPALDLLVIILTKNDTFDVVEKKLSCPGKNWMPPGAEP